MKKKINHYVHGEARTRNGQLIEFSCPPEDKEKVTETIANNIRFVNLPNSHKSVTGHGSHGGFSRFKLKQHKYAGGGPGEYGEWGYTEVLEIENPPEGRHPFVIYEANSDGRNTFYEWKTLDQAIAAYEKHWSNSDNRESFPKLPGFKRMVLCGLLVPWFYALGDEDLLGDYAFPDGLQDDPVFRFGERFVCYENDVPVIKTCMGTRFVEETSRYDDEIKKKYRLVIWHDGSMWNEDKEKNQTPRPLVENELWITEAMEKFKKFLSGKTDKFEINFINGQKFIGHLTPKKDPPESPAGGYDLAVTFKSGKPARGWVQNFVPTLETPNIIEHVKKGVAAKGREVDRIEILGSRLEKGGKKWSGVFYAHP
jgi:hypothetical protein